jgi:gliding motility-associated-like protein
VEDARLFTQRVKVYVLSLLGLIVVTQLTAQTPAANFSASITSGCSPLIIQFTDQSTGSPTSWLWDLGNGSTSSVKNPTTTYINPGSYTVKLTATNASGSNTITKTAYITVNAIPNADFTSDKTTGCTPLNVQFTDQSGGGTITQWEWNFGDGGTSNSQNPQHTYTVSGTFNVYLKVTSSSGCSKTVFKQQYIKAGTGASADFVYNVPTYCQIPVNVNFTNTSNSEDDSPAYLWDFGDGSTSSIINPSHTYNTSGNFNVKLTIQTSSGCNSTIQKAITLSNKSISISGPTSVCAGTPVSYTMNTNGSTTVSQTWSTGDGANYYSPTMTHTFFAPGSYLLKLTAEFNGGCTVATSQNITVMSNPVIDFTGNNINGCKPPLASSFQTSSPGTYLWEFGDGGTSNQQNPTYTFQSAGEFNINLTVTNSNGCSTKLQKDKLVKIVAPTIALTNVPANGCAPYSFTPVASINAPDGVSSYSWNFGDGGTSSDSMPVHNYSSSGSYPVSVTITTKGGCQQTASYSNAVILGNGSAFDFTAIPNSVCIEQNIQFNISNGVGVTFYNWSFGDGETSSLASPIHSYKHTGLYSITLEVTYGNCTSKLTKQGYVTITPPEAKFIAIRDCNQKRLIQFTSQSVGANTYQWNFGDGATSTSQNPNHLYSADGNYVVSLTVSNGTCTHTLKDTIEVMNIGGIDFVADQNPVCQNTYVKFTVNTANTVSISQYQWTVQPNSGTAITTENSISWGFWNPGIYSVVLTAVYQNGCQETITKTNYMTIYGPSADFRTDKYGGCVGSTINFADSSFSDGTNPITQWQWDFGDSTQSMFGTNVSHTFNLPGRFSIKLKLTDSYGCIDSVVKTEYINITNGKANFTSVDSMSCLGKNIVFRDTSSGSVIFWNWDFGDGTSAIDIQNPSHMYADSGYYTIKLRIEEASGCVDSITKTNYVTIKNPKAKFAISDTFSTCPPLTVQFTDQSYYVKKWSWDFDDGGSSPIQHPINTYFIPDTLNVKLVVTSPGGCRDSTFGRIRILGPYGSFNYTPKQGCVPLTVNFNITSTSAIKFLWDYSDGITDSGTVASSAHVYNDGGIFVPKAILTDAAGCSVPVVGTDTIFSEKTYLEFTADTIAYCDAGTINFANNSTAHIPNTLFQWNFGDGGSANTLNSSHNYVGAGWYNVTLISTTPSGCTDTLIKPDYIHINRSPQIIIQGDSVMCRPASFTFLPQVAPDTATITTWSWTFGNGQTSNQQNPSSQSFLNAGNYQNNLDVISSNGCSATFSKPVVVNDLPSIVASQDITICRGNTTQLFVSGGVSYEWLNPDNLSCTNCSDPTASPVVDILYKVKGTSALGCSSYDSVLIKVFQHMPLVVTPISDSVCLGSSIQLKATGPQLFSWSPSIGLNAINISNPKATPASATSYTVVGTDSLGCFTDSATIAIKVLQNPTVNAGSDITITSGSTANISCTASPDVVSYLWTPAKGLSCDNCPNPVLTAGSQPVYYVKVTSDIGCTATDTLQVFVTCSDANVFVPNTFTPNGDGMNDVFYIRGNGVFAVKSLRIFNRWGEMVFEKKDITANDPKDGWNGIVKGAKASTDAYVYQLEVLCTNSQVLKYNGTITLLQ